MKNFGFTLVELMVVILIIGILAAIGYPQYIRTMEVSKANNAVALVAMAGNADRMYAVDHNGNYVQSGPIGNNCNLSSNSCGTSGVCDLVACGYMASDDYSEKAYLLTVGQCIPGNYCAAVATASRNSTGAGDSTTTSPYKNWSYRVDSNGVVSANAGAPPPPQ